MKRCCSLLLLAGALLAGPGCLLPKRSVSGPKKKTSAKPPAVNVGQDSGWPTSAPTEHVTYDRIQGGIE